MFEAAHRTSGVLVRSATVIVLSTSTEKLPSDSGKKVGDVDSADDLVPFFYVRLVSATRWHAKPMNVTAK